MNRFSHLRSLLMAGSALALVSACSEADIESLGNPGPVTIGGGTTGATGVASLNFVPASGCPAGTESRDFTASNATEVSACAIPGGTIVADLSLPAGVYSIDGAVFVGNDNANSATLTIAPGSILFGQSGNDYIVVSRGSQIDAQGTAASPIVFTSANDISEAPSEAQAMTIVSDASSNGNADANGEWGGIVVSGNAEINDCNDNVQPGGRVDCVKFGEGNSGLFGGDDNTDNSGTLRYVRVQYAGFRVNDEDELNGIAFQGTGDGTTAEFIQVHNNLDDGIEWFGGATNVSYAVVTGAGDDSFDWTDGWVGNLQFAVVLQSDTRGDRGIEADNRNGSNDDLPRSNPNIANFTFIGGANADTGMVLRRGTAGNYINGIITDFQDAGIDLDDDATAMRVGASDAAGDEALTFNSLFVAGNAENLETDGDAGDAATVAAFAADPNNTQAAGATLNDGLFPGPSEDAVTAADPAAFDADLMTTNYVGAFPSGTTGGSVDNWAAGWTVGLPFDEADTCPAGTVETNTAVPAGRTEARVCLFSSGSAITSDIRLTRGNLYQLQGAVFIGEDNANSATLTIDPGVTIFGVSGNDYIVISRGSQIQSNGTAAAPVVMTSLADINGDNIDDPMTAADESDANGQWGGLVVSGNAEINDCNDNVQPGGRVDCLKFGEGNSGLFGGDDNTDNSGDITFTRIQFAGFRVNDEDELNGIAFQGVGNGGTYDYIQVHNNLDDGLEWFGGAANASHVVITGAGDDSLDWTDGWVGNLQFAIVVQSDLRGDRGIEADNRNGSNDDLPRSNPTISNFTFLGGALADTGMVLRRGTAGAYANGVITAFQDAGVDLDDAATAARVGATDAAGDEALTFNSMFVGGNNQDLETDGDAGDAATVTAFAADPNNTTGAAPALSVGADDTGITAALVPTAAGNVDTATAFDPTTFNAFFGAGSYVGAVEDDADNWYVGWTFGL